MKNSSPNSAVPATVIKATPGKPWPDPPHGGNWERNTQTGDLTLLQAPGELSVEERSQQKAKRQAEVEAEAARRASATTNTPKE